MPDLLRLRFLGDQARTVPVVGRAVEPEELVDVPGRIATAEDLKAAGVNPPGDDALAVLLGNPPEVRLFPLSMWRDETPAAKKPKE